MIRATRALTAWPVRSHNQPWTSSSSRTAFPPTSINFAAMSRPTPFASWGGPDIPVRRQTAMAARGRLQGHPLRSRPGRPDVFPVLKPPQGTPCSVRALSRHITARSLADFSKTFDFQSRGLLNGNLSQAILYANINRTSMPISIARRMAEERGELELCSGLSIRLIRESADSPSTIVMFSAEICRRIRHIAP